MQQQRRLRLAGAVILREPSAMARPQTIRLREATSEPTRQAQVIDVPFKEVGGGRRTIWGRFKLAIVAIFWAALIGFLIPPLWLLMQRISEQFAPI